MLANALDEEDLEILDAAMSGEPIEQKTRLTDSVAPARRELSLSTGVAAARGATMGVCIGTAFWLLVLVAMIGH